jgi:hypothetical protein
MDIIYKEMSEKTRGNGIDLTISDAMGIAITF